MQYEFFMHEYTEIWAGRDRSNAEIVANDTPLEANRVLGAEISGPGQVYKKHSR